MKDIKPPRDCAQQARDLLEGGAKQIPAALVRGMFREWDREFRWNETMCTKLERILQRYGP